MSQGLGRGTSVATRWSLNASIWLWGLYLFAPPRYHDGIDMAQRLPSPILSPVIPGRATLLQSSTAFPLPGVLLERYVSIPGERALNCVDRHVLGMLCSPVSRGEHRTADGQFVPYRKRFGALTVFPKGPVPEMRLRTKSELLFCAFDESFVSNVKAELEGALPPPLEFRSGIHDRALFQILNLLLMEMNSGRSPCALYLDHLAHALTLRFLFLAEDPPPELSADAPALPNRKLVRVKEFIESHLDGDLKLRDLARESGYSTSHFLRMFHAATDMTPHRYVLRQRLERARRLLAHSDVSCADVAYSCGFSSQSHMTLAFRNECGTTPAEYRRTL